MDNVIYLIVLALLTLVGIILATLLAVPKEHLIYIININIVSVLLGVIIARIYSCMKEQSRSMKQNNEN